MAKKTGLGRGLGAIFEEVEDAYNKDLNSSENRSSVKEIDLESIEVNPFQPRKTFDKESLLELSESIKKHGLLQPVLVIRSSDGYILIAGERRFRATKLAGFTKIKAVIGEIPKESFREIALIENIQRENLNPVDLANSYKELIEDYSITHDELASIVHKSRAHITNSMRILQLSDYAISQLEKQNISQGHGKVLVGLDEKTQRKIVDSIINQNLNVRQTESLVKNFKPDDKKTTVSKTKTQLDTSSLESILKEEKIAYALNKNKLVFNFSSQEDVNKIVKLFG